MSIQRGFAAVLLLPDELLALDGYLRDALRRDTRTTGSRRAVLYCAMQAVNAAAAEVADQVRAERASSTGRSGPRDASTRSPAPASTPWISVIDTAEQLGLSTGHVRRMCRNGRLAALHGPDGAWRIDPTAAASWI